MLKKGICRVLAADLGLLTYKMKVSLGKVRGRREEGNVDKLVDK
jgi:hypothetical protein